MDRRGKIEIYMDILEVAQGRLKPTLIAYGAKISYKQFQDSVDFLIKKELLRVDGDGVKFYVTTEKGKNLLEYWNEILKIL